MEDEENLVKKDEEKLVMEVQEEMDQITNMRTLTTFGHKLKTRNME
jgi:hypothetical protein